MSLFSDLVAKANVIKNETVDEANSADRIGQMFIDLINFAAATSGIKKGMTIEWDLNLGPIPTGFVLADGYGGVKNNGVTVPDHRDSFAIGYNPAKYPLPLNATDLTENYGKIGNTGGKNWYRLTGAQSGLQAHDHPITDIESDNSGDAKNAFKIENTNHINTATMKTASCTAKDATADHDNRPQYIVVCKITKVSDDYTAEYNSAWHSYLDTTTDNPKLTEAEWVAALKGAEQDLSALATKIALESGLQQKVDKVPGKSLIADTEITRLAGVSNVDISGKENVGVAAQLISDLKAGVPSAGDTLLKLFNEIGLKINRTETLTASEIQLLVSNLVDSAPETLNTLHELANALGDDPNFATTITTLIGTKLNASKAAIEALLTGLISSHYHTAAATTFVPFATITSGNVQSAIEQLYAEKASVTTANNLWNEIDKVKQLAGISEGWVGRRWDPLSPGTRMTSVNVVDVTSFFSQFKVVSLGDNGQEIATLATGNSAMSGDLTGANGQIMLKIPQIYYREIFNIAGQRCGIDLSLTPVSGFKLHEKFSWGNGRGEIYVGCFEGGEVAAKMTSVTGVPVSTSKTIAEFRAMALARGTGWHAYDYYTHHLLEMLFYVYYGKLNSQEFLPGYTEHTWAENFKKNTGLIAPAGWPGTAQGNDDGGWTGTSRVIGNSFLWIENLYGHVWKFLDGCVFDGRVGKQNTAYLTPNPLLFSSVDSEILSRYINMNIDLPAASNENYLSSTGALGLPKTHGGDSSTYVTDYFWSYLDDATRDYLRVVFAGGDLDLGALAGVAARHSISGLGFANSTFASRLCYEKN